MNVFWPVFVSQVVGVEYCRKACGVWAGACMCVFFVSTLPSGCQRSEAHSLVFHRSRLVFLSSDPETILYANLTRPRPLQWPLHKRGLTLDHSLWQSTGLRQAGSTYIPPCLLNPQLALFSQARLQMWGGRTLSSVSSRNGSIHQLCGRRCSGNVGVRLFLLCLAQNATVWHGIYFKFAGQFRAPSELTLGPATIKHSYLARFMLKIYGESKQSWEGKGANFIQNQVGQYYRWRVISRACQVPAVDSAEPLCVRELMTQGLVQY